MSSDRSPQTTPDWRQHAIALAAAIQRFRNELALRRLIKLRRTPGFAALCDAWEAYSDAAAQC